MGAMSSNSKHISASAGAPLAAAGEISAEADETPAKERNLLRMQAKAARKALSPEEKAQKSELICRKLAAQLDSLIAATAEKPCTIAVYSAFPWEADLAKFIDFAYNQGCIVAFPCMMSNAHGIADAPGRGMREPGCDPDAPHTTQQTMEMRTVPAETYRTNSVPFLNNPLKEYCHESPELAGMPYIAANEIDFLVVPAVGFDESGNRLGYGAGNYDRYLSQLTTACHVVGVAFAEQQTIRPIPAEAHDIPLPFVFA